MTAKKTIKGTAVSKQKHIGIVERDSWLEPFENAISGRHNHALWKLDELTCKGKKKLSDFATGYLYFGLHRLRKDGYFGSGHQMLLIFIWSVILMDGKSRLNIASNR